LSVVARAHQTLAAVISPGHDISDGFRRGGEAIKQRRKVDFEQLNKVLVTAIAYKGGLITD
jgi:hypothetical protein